jgi:hypothetical protein
LTKARRLQSVANAKGAFMRSSIFWVLWISPAFAYACSAADSASGDGPPHDAIISDAGAANDGVSFADGGCANDPARACGDTCCAEGSVCLFDKCVVPGAECRTAHDCPEGQYCDPALGDGGAPVPTGCSAGVTGRCLPAPPVCEDGGGPAGCTPECEYRPAAGPLDVETLWEWGDGLGPNEYPNHVDVWSTPVVGRMRDGNCDGRIDEADPPTVVFISGDARKPDAGGSQLGVPCQIAGASPSGCQTGVVRAVDGATGKTLWTVAHDPGASGEYGFAGVTPALADIDNDGVIEVIAAVGDGHLAVIDAAGKVVRRSDEAIEETLATNDAFGWGGGIAVADIDGDGAPEIAFGHVVFTTRGGTLKRKWSGTGGQGGPGVTSALSTFANASGVANDMNLLAGSTVYKKDGSVLWSRSDLGPASTPNVDGFPAIADLNKDGKPEIVVVAQGLVHVLAANTGVSLVPPYVIGADAGTGQDAPGHGGPPTIADFDGDGFPDIGISSSDFYFVLRTTRNANGALTGLQKLWTRPTQDGSSRTGSTVFDFEGDGKAEVVYAEECFLWVWGFDNGKPSVRLAIPTNSFTGTEASIVADVDGDGHANLVVVANRVVRCTGAPWNVPDPVTGRAAWAPPAGEPSYRGLRVLRDRRNAWVGTRTLWNQHTYHLTNICDPHDSACAPNATYGSIPRHETPNWTLPWANSFRQNTQEKGAFDAPDAVASLHLACTSPPSGRVDVRNLGRRGLPLGVRVGIFEVGTGTKVDELVTTRPLAPGQTDSLTSTKVEPGRDYVARVLVDASTAFRECRENNNESAPARLTCAK